MPPTIPHLTISLVVTALWAHPGPAQAAKLSPNEILDKVDDLYRGNSSRGKVTMKVVTANWSRELKLEIWSKGTEKSLIRILAPRKEKGMATLKSGKNIHNYLPKVKKVIKVPSSMMGGSSMGSHFTHDDLVKENRMAEQFTFDTTFEGERGGRKVVEITCIPKEDAAVVWGKIVVEVEMGTWLPRSQRFYDEDMELARTFSFAEVKTMAGRTLPTLMRVTPADKPEESTEALYDDIAFDVRIDDRVFTLRNLQR